MQPTKSPLAPKPPLEASRSSARPRIHLRPPLTAHRLLPRVLVAALLTLAAAPAPAVAPIDDGGPPATPRAVNAAADGEARHPAEEEAVPAEDAEDEDATEAGEPTPAARFEQRLTVTATAPDLASETLPGRSLDGGAGLDAVEHLRDHPGLAAARRGAVNLDPQVRGLSETQVATLVDGTRTFAAGPARMDSGLSHANPHAVGRVEVVKGPYALTWGAGALSAIRFESRQVPFSSAGFTWSGGAGLRLGDNAAGHDLFARAAGSGERFRFLLLAGDRSGDDYETGSGTTVPGDFESTEARLRLGWQAGDGLLLEADGGYQGQEDLDYAGRILDATYFTTRSYAARGTWTPAGDGVDSVAGLLYANRKDHRMNNDEKPTARPMPGRVPPFGLDVDLPTESNTLGGRLAVDGRRGGVTWTAGADAYRAEQDARRSIRRRDDGRLLFADVVWPEARLEDGGLFAQARGGHGRLAVAGAVRWDRWSAEAREPVSPFFAANAAVPRPRDEDLWSAAVSGRLAFGAASRQALSFGLGRAVRTPTALELYSDRFPSTRFQVAAELLGDPSLEPETALQADLGWSWQDARWGFALDAFARRLEDPVTVRPDPTLPRRLPLSPPVVYRYVNGSRTDFVGAEARLDGRLGDDWRLLAHASWLRGEEQGVGGAADEPAFGMAPPRGRLALRWQPAPGRAGRPAWRARTWVDAALRHAEPQDRVATSRLERETPGWTVLDLGAGHRFGAGSGDGGAGRWELALGVDNVLDEAYAEHLNALDPFRGERIEEPGRSWFARVEVEF